MRQRQAWQRRHDVADVIAEAATATLEGTDCRNGIPQRQIQRNVRAN